MIDAEYLVKRWGDSELSLVLGASSRAVSRAHYLGRRLLDTGGQEMTASYGAQIAIRSSYAIEFAYRSNVLTRMRWAQPRLGSEVVIGFRLLK